MKAPEKIWINPSLDLPKLNGVIDKDSIQYVRKDAFIDKACGWLRCQDEMIGISFEEDFIERFKNYIKGE